MAVYIDDFYKTDGSHFRRMKISHLIADSREELFAITDKLKLKRKYLQKENTSHEHFDVCMSKRKEAIKLGAIEVSYRRLGAMVMNRKPPPLWAFIPFKLILSDNSIKALQAQCQQYFNNVVQIMGDKVLNAAGTASHKDYRVIKVRGKFRLEKISAA